MNNRYLNLEKWLKKPFYVSLPVPGIGIVKHEVEDLSKLLIKGAKGKPDVYAKVTKYQVQIILTAGLGLNIDYDKEEEAKAVVDEIINH
jgi:hypothetical protein